MKTAISIPDVIYQDAERMAKRRGMSRSELYANAVAEYVSAERYMGVGERLDAVYGGSKPPDSRLDPAFAQIQSASLDKDEW